jgi:broad specificity phosphatase PhoE
VGRKEVISMPGVLARLYLVRHGETAWSLSGQHTGRTDIPLTEQGEHDARKLAGRLRAVRFTRVLTSPLQRARRTCELAGLSEVAEISTATLSTGIRPLGTVDEIGQQPTNKVLAEGPAKQQPKAPARKTRWVARRRGKHIADRA